MDTTLALVSEEHQEALAPILLTILSYAREGAAFSDDLAADAGERFLKNKQQGYQPCNDNASIIIITNDTNQTHTADLAVQLAKALPAAPPSSTPTLHQRVLEQATGVLLANPPPYHEAACRHRALFLRVLAALAAAHRSQWGGPVLDVLLHDDLLAWVRPSSTNGALVLAWCRALAAVLGGGAAGGARAAKAQAAMATMIAALWERAGALLRSCLSEDDDEAGEEEEQVADVLESLLSLGSAGRREPLEAVLAGALSLLQQQVPQAALPLVTLIAALAAVDVWGVVEAALLGPSPPPSSSSQTPAALQLLFSPSNCDGEEGQELAAVVILLRAARGTATDQQPVQDLLLASSSNAMDDAMEVVDGVKPLRLSLLLSSAAASSSSSSSNGWPRYRVGREAFLHGYFPLAHRSEKGVRCNHVTPSRSLSPSPFH